MENIKQHDHRTTRRPDCVTEIRMGNSVLVGAGTGSGSRCYTKKGDLTSCKEADLSLLPLYSRPCSVVQ